MTLCRLAMAVVWSLLLLASDATAQLRIIQYNTHSGPNPGLGTVLAAIGSEITNGFSKAPDILALQEQSGWDTTTQGIAGVLNSIELFAQEDYLPVQLDGATSGGGRPGLIYNAKTVELIGAIAFGSVNTSAQARESLRYQFRPVGYDEAADFYVYSNHYKAGSSSTDRARRNVEALALRDNLNSLGDGVHAILAGDYNIQSSNEAMYQTLLAGGEGDAAYGQAFDPIDSPGSWNNNSSYKHLHTQAPSASPPTGFTGGGMDDRFDFQLVTGELLDGEGLSYIPDSYHPFGNNGTHDCCNSDITTGSGASLDVLNALVTSSDHLPVVADYQLPAMLEVVSGEHPTQLTLGEAFSYDVMIRNSADVLVSLGADELDYELSVFGDLIGGAAGTVQALAAAHLHPVEFATDSIGMKTGEITISATSQGAANRLVILPIIYEVIAPHLAGDYNRDGFVDAADYTVWRDSYGEQGPGLNADGNGNLLIDEGDYEIWVENFGSISSERERAAVPEPMWMSPLLALLTTMLCVRKRRVQLGHIDPP